MITLARRFILICLVFSIFAMLMAAAVANSDRTSRPWRSNLIGICSFDTGAACPLRN